MGHSTQSGLGAMSTTLTPSHLAGEADGHIGISPASRPHGNRGQDPTNGGHIAAGSGGSSTSSDHFLDSRTPGNTPRSHRASAKARRTLGIGTPMFITVRALWAIRY